MKGCKVMQNFETLSLETHLFFGRIMKEHSLFLMTGFLQKDSDFYKKADWYRRQFEEFLREVVSISGNAVNADVLESGELVTEFTDKAERKTSCLTGIPIDGQITNAEKRLYSGCSASNRCQMRQRVRQLNERALRLTEGLIGFKESILAKVDDCSMFTGNYPLLLRHIIREARLYRSIILELNRKGTVSSSNLAAMERFWNQIMMEHALFIRGLLDPSEEDLIRTADGFAEDYKKLLSEAKIKNDRTMGELTRKTLEETARYREFKAEGTQGIINCKIASLILPLLADHVLREANHYLRILEAECDR